MMEDRRLESIGEAAQRSTERIARDAEEMANRAGGYARDLADRATDWVKEYPLQTLALTIAVGFVLGKIMARD